MITTYQTLYPHIKEDLAMTSPKMPPSPPDPPERDEGDKNMADSLRLSVVQKAKSARRRREYLLRRKLTLL